MADYEVIGGIGGNNLHYGYLSFRPPLPEGLMVFVDSLLGSAGNHVSEVIIDDKVTEFEFSRHNTYKAADIIKVVHSVVKIAAASGDTMTKHDPLIIEVDGTQNLYDQHISQQNTSA